MLSWDSLPTLIFILTKGHSGNAALGKMTPFPIMKNTCPGLNNETFEVAIKIMNEANVTIFGPDTNKEKKIPRIN